MSHESWCDEHGERFDTKDGCVLCKNNWTEITEDDPAHDDPDVKPE